MSAIPYKPVEPTNPHFWEYQAEGTRVLAREAQAASSTDRVETDLVGTGAFARPGREATVPPAATATTPNAVAAAVPPHNFKKPATVALAPHERKIRANAASRG